MDWAGPTARILLRYGLGALVVKYGLSIDVSDPDLVNVLSFMLSLGASAMTEGWYYLARKNGWGT